MDKFFGGGVTTVLERVGWNRFTSSFVVLLCTDRGVQQGILLLSCTKVIMKKTIVGGSSNLNIIVSN